LDEIGRNRQAGGVRWLYERETNDSGHLYAAAFLGNAVSHFTVAH
jgi:hypothetical protein